MNRRDLLITGGALGIVSIANQSLAQSALGFYVPAEETRHQRTFMQWPSSRKVYSDRFLLEIVQQAIADIANTIAEFEPVVMLAAAKHHAQARRKLSSLVELWDVPTEDLWCRDAGPVFVISDSGGLAVSQIQFNGWGKKQVHNHDARIAGLVAKHLDLPILPTGLFGEAGGVEQDGRGLLMAHESSWVNDNRNPGLTRDEIEGRLLAAYGANRMIWSDGVWGEDITDYHIDSLARFTGPNRVLMNLPDKPDMNDPFHTSALDTHDRLLAENVQVETIPEPNIRRVSDLEFVASYVNYYVCNGAVITSQFGDRETDEIAQEALSRHFPGREIVALNVDILGELGGGIHCATQQMPAVQ
ncbi:agmatine deiminase family protein [Rhodobacteraceae bacterium B1Z28]|uniref:Agmatine deiminase family protein n=1 Tax=Ruegeria haliotis TaxID=2747601 RepID=A0ABX2PPP0_9RHOB|nr:agmatine deiminase family protein [Ruegeria haliotis]NVO55582.1 agmatine deiminase family protein [Ruegeria haliotis]